MFWKNRWCQDTYLEDAFPTLANAAVTPMTILTIIAKGPLRVLRGLPYSRVQMK